MDGHGKSQAKNKRKKNKKKNQDANAAERNDQPAQPQVPAVHVQQKGQQHANLGQPNKIDKNKAANQAEVSESVYLNQRNLKCLQRKEIQEMKQSVSEEMDKVAKLLVAQMREINKTQQTFDLRVFGSSHMNPGERAKETQKAIKHLAEKMRLREKCAPQTLLDKQEGKLQEICFKYDELSKLLQRLEDLEDDRKTHNTSDAHAKSLAAKGEIAEQEFKEKILTCKPQKIEHPCQPRAKQSEQQNISPTNFKTTQNGPGKIYPAEKVLGGSHHAAANIDDQNMLDEVLLRSSPKDEHDKSNASQQQLSSDDSNEFLAIQAFAAPMKFLRRVKKKVGNLFFSPRKERAKDGPNDANGENIDIEAGAGAVGGAAPSLCQPVPRTFNELQNDTAHGKASNKRGLEQIPVAPEARASLTTKTTMAQGREEKETDGGRSAGLTTHGKGFKATENGIKGKNADNKHVPVRETSLNVQTPQRNGVEGIKGKTAAEVKPMGVGRKPQGLPPNTNHNIQSVAVKPKVVPAASHVNKQMSHVVKGDAPSKSATPSPTIPQPNTKQTPNVKVAGKAILPAINIGPNPTPKASSPKSVQVQYPTLTSASPQNFPGKASIPTKAVGVSASNTTSPVASGARVQSKDQKCPQPQPQLLPQKEPRKDVISKTPAQGVATKRNVLEEKKVTSPGKPSQEAKDTTAQVPPTNKSSPAPSSCQQGTTKKGNDSISRASNKQENHADGSKGILKKEKSSSSRVPQIAASLPPSPKTSTVANHTNTAIQEVKSSKKEAEIKQDSTQASSPCERRILKARRRITFEEDKRPEVTGSAELPAITEEDDYEPVMPEEFEQAVAEAMDEESFSEQSSPKEKQTNRPSHTRNCAPLQDIPESSAVKINADEAKEKLPPMQAGRKKKNKGKYSFGFINPRKSINCCCEYECDYCVPAWEWDKVVANQRKKR